MVEQIAPILDAAQPNDAPILDRTGLLTVALPKGRLLDEALVYLELAGYGLRGVGNGRQLARPSAAGGLVRGKSRGKNLLSRLF